MSSSKVLLPLPVLPTRPSVVPASTVNEMSCNTVRPGVPSVVGYANETWRNSKRRPPACAGRVTGVTGSTMSASASRISVSRANEAAPRWNRLITQPSAINGHVRLPR